LRNKRDKKICYIQRLSTKIEVRSTKQEARADIGGGISSVAIFTVYSLASVIYDFDDGLTAIEWIISIIVLN
jgi:hypothetical protein